MERRKFFKILVSSIAAPTVVIKAVEELSKTAKGNVISVNTKDGNVTITTPSGEQFEGLTSTSGKSPTYVHPGDMDLIYLKENKFQEGDHIYNENGFYVIIEDGPVLIGQMFEQGRKSAF